MCSHQVQRSRISGGRLGSPQTHHTYCLLDLGDILEPLPPSTCPSVKWDDGDVNKAGWGLKLILHGKARPRVGSGRPLGTLLLHPAACRARQVPGPQGWLGRWWPPAPALTLSAKPQTMEAPSTTLSQEAGDSEFPTSLAPGVPRGAGSAFPE